MSPSYTLTNDSLTIILDGKTFSLRRGAKNYDAARKAIIEEKWDALPSILSPGLAITKWLGGGWDFVEHFITFEGEKVDQKLNDRMLAMAEDGSSPKGWMMFWERLQANPSWRSVNQLYAFLTHEGIPIDEADGHILAYKAVRRDYKDFHSGKFDNSPGVTNKMSRNKISDDPNVACHVGFHVGAIGYASTFGSSDRRIVICKVDPADVVCVPYDASAMKVRVCKYTIIGNYSGTPLPSTSFKEDADEDFQGHYDSSVEDYEESEDDDDGEEVEIRDEKVEVGSTVSPWAKFDAMSEDALLSEVLPELRAYAAHGLKITGASKIPGGKAALVERILEVRKK